MIRSLTHLSLFVLLISGNAFTAAAETSLAMHGAAKYTEDFKAFQYVNPDAPKGGHLRLPAIGSFNSLNPFLIKGVAPKGLRLVYQSLLLRSADEPFTLYGNLAEHFEMPEDRSEITFRLNPKARFSDGTALTPQDVLFSWESLRLKGRPNHRQYYGQVETATILDDGRLRFVFKENAGREIPLILGLMPIVSKAFFSNIPFEQTSLVAPVGTGPYMVDQIDPGRRVRYRRNPDFWGWGLPAYQGRYNFSTITFDYFRDADIAFEAFAAGELDAYFENDPGKWVARKSASPAKYQALEVPITNPAPMLGLAFNTRQSVFEDIRVRRALGYAFDFNWINRNLLHGLYARTTSYFQNSILAATGLPSQAETDLLIPFKQELPTDLFNTPFTQPESTDSKSLRRNLRLARKLLLEAGWKAGKSGLLTNVKGEIFKFEILLQDSQYLKILSGFQKNLATLGIKATVRRVDTASYQARLNAFDFDMIVREWGESLSPGNEQAFYWHSAAANQSGSRNYPAIKSLAIDKMIDTIITARNRDDLENATRALDRVLQWGHYVIPLYHNGYQWLYQSKRTHMPEKSINKGTTIDLWWQSPIDE
jgi:peptide/nickel transport system substrate-binding protein